MSRSRYITHDGRGLGELLEQVAAGIDEIERILDELERRANALRPRWSGEAAASYDAAHRRWDASLRDLHAIGRQLATIAKGASARLTAHDEAAARVWQI
jgi:WXG100 family type VII secretion target